jgi:nicotinamidase-related amidase
VRRDANELSLLARPHGIESVVAVTEDPRQAALAEVMALVLQGRPERITSLLLANAGPEAQEVAKVVADTVAALALALPPEALPSDPAEDPLRRRVLASLEAAEKARPRAALLVIDMQNDHLTPGGSVEVPRARDIVPAVAARLDAARQSGVPVVYIIDQHSPDDPDLDAWTTHNVEGSVGAEVWPAIAPVEGDHRVTKSTYSAFTGSKLELVLDELRVDTLVLTGCATELGLLATAMDALQRGYAIEVPPDSQAGTSDVAEGVALTTLTVLAPFGPARRERLARLAAVAG